MTDFCTTLAMSLLRTTAFLAAAAIVVGLLLKLTRCQSPRVHRVAWCAVILQGLLFARIPWAIHWMPQPQSFAMQTGNSQPLEEPITSPIGPDNEFSPMISEDTVATAPLPIAEEQPSSTDIFGFLRRDWSLLAVVLWLCGIIVIAGTWLFRYVRFIRNLPDGESVPDDWQQEFLSVLGDAGHRSEIELRITDDTGPLVCRRWGEYTLVIPKSLWKSLTSAQRLAILRHEIGHYRRGDLWKSIAVRALALSHWFNPFAWFAIRRFDEAAEWACDELATGDNVAATEFANTLLKICESTNSHGTIVPAARGSSVKRRIGRLISLPSKGDSIMRKSIVFGLIAVFLAAGSLEVRLVADEPQLPVGLPSLPEPDLEEANADYAHQMINDAKTTFRATQAAYDAGTVSMEPLYTWSRKWLQATLDVTAKRDERLAAYQEHRDRMKQLYNEVHAKFLVGAKGGEAERNYAAKFYLAEANLWLTQQTAKTGTAAGVSDKNAGARIEVYPISVADSNTVVKVVQTMLDGAPDVRVTTDPKTNSLVVQARPAEHARIRELLGKLDARPREFVVNPAAKAGPNAAVPGVEIATRPGPGMPASTQATYEVKSPAELIKILQPLLAGQSRVEMKSLGNNSQLIVSAPAEQQDAIRALVTHLEPPAKDVVRLVEPQKRIVAKFTNVDVDTAQKMLPQIAPADSNYEVIYDFRDKSLVVKAPSVKSGERNLEPGDLRPTEEPGEKK
jgi:beta-lactamase regulating signal transducer with metallopeptidase domain